jgi:hypothetical protein
MKRRTDNGDSTQSKYHLLLRNQQIEISIGIDSEVFASSVPARTAL